MQHKEYNGWWNYETWAVKLWLDNDYGTYTMMQGQAGEALENNTEDGETDADGFRREMADWLKNHHEERAGELLGEASVFSDLVNAALSEVNWDEIADAYLAEAKEAAGI